MYHNLKEDNNANLKGEIGEIIANYHLKETIYTKKFHYNILNRFNLNLKQISFLKENWKSFDLVDPLKLIIYEVKTRKFFKKKLKGVKNKIVITPNFSKLCEKANLLGFLVKIIEITLFSDWGYGITIKEFDKEDFWVHRPRPSGWARQKKTQARKLELNNQQPL